MLYPTVVAKLEQYMLSCDPAALDDIVATIQSEKNDPSIQDTIMRIPMISADFNRASQSTGYVKLNLEAVDYDKSIIEDKMIRVFCADAGAVPTHICMVANVDDEFVKLIPALDIGEPQQA